MSMQPQTKMPSNLGIAEGTNITREDHCKVVARMQAQIDALMLEYCPEDMIPSQIANWAAHQQVAEDIGIARV